MSLFIYSFLDVRVGRFHAFNRAKAKVAVYYEPT